MAIKYKGSTIFLLLIMVCLVAPNAYATVFSQCPVDEDGVDTDGDGDPDNDYVCMHLAAGDGFVNMADGKLQYIFGFSNVTGVDDGMVMMEGMTAATFPAPTIELRQGQVFFLSLTNVGMMMRPDLFDPHTVHFHGFPNASAYFDGVPDASVSVNMGSTFTYMYNLVEDGTFMYHCHVEASEHMQMGMLGNLYVKPMQDGTTIEYPAGSGEFYEAFAYNDGDGSTGYNRSYPLQVASFDPEFHDASLTIQPLPFAYMDDKYGLLNGRGYPDTINPNQLANTETGQNSQQVSSLIQANKGEKILLRISSLSTTEFFTLTVLGIPMQVVGQGAKILRSTSGENLYYNTSSVTVGGGEAVDVILDTSKVRVGTYFLYTTNLNYLSNDGEDFGGMMTEIQVLRPGTLAAAQADIQTLSGVQRAADLNLPLAGPQVRLNGPVVQDTPNLVAVPLEGGAK